MATQGRPHARAVLLAFALAAASPVLAQTRADCEREYRPQRAQEGKDVIWAPTEDAMVRPTLELANVTAADTVYDLGAGDGKIVIAAAKEFGATGVGVEYDADLVKHARCLAAAEGVADRVTFIQGDIFETDFSDATVVALYLTPRVNARLLPTLLAMQPGTRVVSYSFGIGDWPSDAEVDSFGEGSAFLFVVPANAAGSWTFQPENGAAFAVELEQRFQHLSGTADGVPVTGKLRGATLELTSAASGETFRMTGTVDGTRIAGAIERGGASATFVGARE